MSVLQNIADELKRQNDINEQILNYFNNQNQNNPDAEEEERDERNRKFAVLSKIGSNIKDIASKIAFDGIKDAGQEFLRILKENLLMGGGILLIQQLIENWPKINEMVQVIGDWLNGPVATVTNFIKEWGGTIFDWIYDRGGLLAVVGLGSAALLAPGRTIVTLFKALRGSLLLLGGLLKGAAFLRGFLGPWGFALLGGAALYSAWASEAQGAETDLENLIQEDGQPDTVPMETADVPEPITPETNSVSTEPERVTPSIPETNNPPTEPERVTPSIPETNSVPTEPERVETNTVTPDVQTQYQNLQDRQESLFFDEDGNIRTLTPEEREEYDLNQRIIQQLITNNPDLIQGSVSTNFGNEISNNLQPNFDTNSLLQQIALNTEITPERQRRQAELFALTLSEKLQIAVQSNLIENSYGVSVDSVNLRTITV